MRVQSYDDEFTAFAAAALPQLRRTAYLLCGDWHRAEDTAQDALVRVYRAWTRVEHQGALFAYAMRVTVRLLIDESRRPWRRERPTGEQLDQSDRPDLVLDTASHVADRDEMVRALAALPPRRRACVVLRYYHDLSVNETAEALGCSEGTVKSQTSQALATLRSLLGDAAMEGVRQ
ncbi:SigE family RNA polymerase sigma factor [Humibacillus sp. DSM 29435]|uniref:SigE family RNA polymerase sigma factor n=1 Tax=Humibacillus sp. DSM 29435 TaxID=1869167 RepID=UPI001C30308B|nr:SigE family RNA polymerase sigma factor [Humibacillus sp. DSM 29435]